MLTHWPQALVLVALVVWVVHGVIHHEQGSVNCWVRISLALLVVLALIAGEFFNYTCRP